VCARAQGCARSIDRKLIENDRIELSMIGSKTTSLCQVISLHIGKDFVQEKIKIYDRTLSELRRP
jgi:hypothetical protein